MKTIIEPFRIKVVEPIRMTTAEEREGILRAAGYNVFLIKADDVLIDLLTDSGTGAMSSLQWSGMMRGDESYAGARSWYVLQDRIQELTGFTHILPTHQGRASERILFELVGGEGKVVPNNSHFDTTRANIEHTGAQAVDLLIEEGKHPTTRYPFKGNMDLAKLENLINEVGVERIPLVMVTVTNNSGGGQPVSLENLRGVRKICDKYQLPFFLDACRFAENAWFIKQREPGQKERSVRQIVRETFDLADGATISAKKDGMVNIGGLLLMRDEELVRRADELLILTEGYLTYGGMAGRDLEAMAQGFEEVVHEDYLQYRIRSTAYLGQRLLAAGIQIVEPPGGHAIYIDARRFCPHIPPAQFPGQALVCGMYRHAGIRGVEIGSVMFGQNGTAPPMELVRLAIPRRVYTQSHVDYVIEAIVEVYQQRDKLRPLEITWEPPSLRHFTARFREL
uniref:Tyrosine phenol-lyase n=1 Tax=uncultured Planctomycetota bacterium TaxID=120965 RepID=A0A5B8JPA9_9BACT|nr:tyrosine phenol-lyase [uncultured Planctomycetota bacterium]